jgi:hypothetical protein
MNSTYAIKLNEMNAREISGLYKTVFESPEGKMVLEDLSRRCFMNQSPKSDTPGRTDYNLGMQSVVMHILNVLLFDDWELIERAKKEQQEREQKEAEQNIESEEQPL